MKEMLIKPFKDKDGQVVIFQRPNAPIIIWAVSTPLGFLFDSGWLGTALRIISFTVLSVWALLEIFSGASFFRRVLGICVVTVLVLVYVVDKIY